MRTFAFVVVVLFLLASKGYTQNHPPIAVNDTITGIIGFPAYVNLLKNDYDPDGDSIYVSSGLSNYQLNDSTWVVHLDLFTPFGYNPYDTITTVRYFIKDEHGSAATALVVVRLRAVAKYEFLDVNNLSALISPFGNHFWDADSSRFEAPKGSGKHAMLNHTVWVAGLDDSSRLHVAAEKYRQGGTDFYTGPISTLYDTSYMLKWNRLWKLDKEQIRHHINNWSSPGYVPIDAIASWPAHGKVALGQPTDIAPYYDSDLDGLYNPMAGDFPLIRGDQAIFFILNDLRGIHTESKGEALGIEIYGMAYAYDHPNDSTLNNTLFMHYDIINRSAGNYHDTYLGLFSDFELGSSTDDYLGSDITNGMVYAYNGDSIDGSGQAEAYGEHPPAIGLKVIGGPLLQPDGIDNPAGNCDIGINGLNFGDGIADNERLGMSNLTLGYTETGPDFYRLMNGSINYGSRLVNGSILDDGEGPLSRYLFPGNSDTTCNWGTGGIAPNGGYNQNGNYWTEKTVNDQPGWRNGVGSVGPFTFNAGQSVPLDYCFTWARDYHGDNNSSVELLRQRISDLKPFLNNLISLPVTYYGIGENKAENLLKVYPNPVHEKANITIAGNEALPYYLYSVNGKLVSTGKLQPGTTMLNFSFLNPGIYLFNCGNRHVKLVKL